MHSKMSALFTNLFNSFRQFAVYAQSSKNSTLAKMSSIHEYDVVVLGGGIVGSSTARELSNRHKNLNIALLEKENQFAGHQSGHNSGVIHSGIYYTPGTLKSKLCIEGFNLMYDYLKKKGIPYKKCGKLIVAVEEHELDGLNKLFQKGTENGVKDLKLIDKDDICKIEPNCVGLKAIYSPHTGIVDYAEVTRSFVKDFEENSGKVHLNFKLNKFELNKEDNYPIKLESEQGESIRAKFVITAAGLYSDKIAQLTGCEKSPKILPFRGEYLQIKEDYKNLVKTNIYPVPDSRFPFLGVHFTPTVHGKIILGPNAILATKREGYKITDFNLSEMYDSFTYSGTLKLAFKYFTVGLDELKRSLFIGKQVQQLQRYVPKLTVDMVESGITGVRAQAVNPAGELVEDFVFDNGKGEIGNYVLHVRNAPSPAATSSLAIAKYISDEFEKKFFAKNNQ